MIIKDQILDFAMGSWGEDRLAVANGLYCVVDGATPLTRTQFSGYHSSAEWMADRLAAYILEQDDAAGSYPTICKSFLQREEAVKNAFANSYDLPCLTTAALRQEGDMLQCWILGDCSIYLRMQNGEICHITDKRVTAFSEKTMQAKQEAIRRGEDPAAAVMAQRIQNMRVMNCPGGYWTVGFCGDIEKEFVQCSVETKQVQAALLCTDGLERLFVHWGVAPEKLLTGEMDLQEAVRYLRERERNGESAEVKQHDDVGAILLENENGKESV